jgi:phosphopantothenoylcysteine synthetase/decarboxylase
MPGPDITVIVCGAPLTVRTPELVSHLQSAGWSPTVVGTPAAMEWLDPDAITRLTGRPPRTAFRNPTQPKAGAASAVLVCPATFNTLNKAAAGAADTYALAQLCEALGSGLPIVIVPMVNDKLWGHPAWQGSLNVLESAGAVLVDLQTGRRGAKPVASGTGDAVVADFDPRWIVSVLPAIS